jgi:hypothetical protein
VSAPKPQAKPERIRDTSWREYALRFAFGGIITAAVALVGTAFGPVIAGLFLAFPAILPASLTLISRHHSHEDASRAAKGAAAGSVGLIGFGAVVWALAPRLAGIATLALALGAWLLIGLGLWWLLRELSPAGPSSGNEPESGSPVAFSSRSAR